MSRTVNQILSETTRDYLAGINPQSPPSPDVLESELLQEINDAIELENAVISKGRKLNYQQTLNFSVIAAIIKCLYPVYRIPCAGNEADEQHDVLGIYQAAGSNKGIYATSEESFRKVAIEYNGLLTQREFTELMNRLLDTSERKPLCSDPDLIAVNNGIFNYKSKTLMPFDPNLVFLSKSHINYIENPVNPNIHNPNDGTDWDVESWMREISDDDEITQLLWEIIGAIIRPNVRWNKSAWFYSQKGENGKGTLCELMRHICGPGTYTSLALADFSSDFALEPLLHSTAIITDENSVGEFISKAAEIKAVITNDVIQVNRKFKTPITFRFRGFMIQCINEMPRMKDKSDSLYRRQLFVPFSKSFSGIAREYIKDDYVRRKDVLEYVLNKVLKMNYYKLSEPNACRNLLAAYKDYNDPIRQFADEMLPQLAWDFVPYTFLYDLYKAWFRNNSPSGQAQGRNTFIEDLRNILPAFQDWRCQDANKRPGNLMAATEPLIIQYALTGWMSSDYKGYDPDKICQPSLAQAYKGIIRVGATTVVGNNDGDIDAA